MVLGNYSMQGWVVPDLEDAMKRWLALGAGPFFTFNSVALPAREYRGQLARDQFVTAHAFLGNLQIELLQPTTDDPSILREVLDKKGEALHHLQFETGVVDEARFDACFARYTSMGFEVAQSMELPGGARNVFFDARPTMDFFIKLGKRPPFLHEDTVKMYEAHVGWDGTDPYRKNPLLSSAAKADLGVD